MRAGRRRREAERAAPSPSAQARAALGPYARGQLTLRALGLTLSLDVPWDVFATHAVDAGTLLLLRNLPERAPASFLDLGCGYGALGLPVAARFPQARALLVDRDLLAVRASAHNARALGLGNVACEPGLGYRDLPADARVDWVLCNVPARIGSRAIAYLLEAGRALLTRAGELRAVVIRDLREAVEAAGVGGLRLAAEGANHLVYAVSPGPSRFDRGDVSVYARDETRIEAGPGQVLTLTRPHDASEDPGHAAALAALLDALPRREPRTALAFRCGYGALPLALRVRHPASRVVAQERDLLDTAFLRRNASALGLEANLRIVEALFPSEALGPREADLVVGELSSSAGPGVFAREIEEALALLVPGGEALLLATEKMVREWRPRAPVLLRRQDACVLRLSRAKRA